MPNTELPRPRLYEPADRPDHPVIDHYRATWNYDDHFDEERLRVGLTAYYGLCSFLDFQIGRILASLEESGFAEDTLVIYTSDHGENLGNRGLWGKCVMYEESSGVPLLVAGPGVAAGTRCAAPVSLVDVYPTVVEFACGALDPREHALPGESLVTLAREPPEDRVVFSEMHDDGSMTGTYMVRRDDWKLVHYVGYPPELFHLAADPFEERNLAGRPETAEIQRRLHDELHRVVDPDAAEPARLRRSAGPHRAPRRGRGDPRPPRLQLHPAPRRLTAPPSAGPDARSAGDGEVARRQRERMRPSTAGATSAAAST